MDFFTQEVAHLEFECQHGPKECLGNKLNACAIKSLVTHSQKPHYLKLINFIYCTMNAENQIKAAYKVFKCNLWINSYFCFKQCFKDRNLSLILLWHIYLNSAAIKKKDYHKPSFIVNPDEISTFKLSRIIKLQVCIVQAGDFHLRWAWVKLLYIMCCNVL